MSFFEIFYLFYQIFSGLLFAIILLHVIRMSVSSISETLSGTSSSISSSIESVVESVRMVATAAVSTASTVSDSARALSSSADEVVDVVSTSLSNINEVATGGVQLRTALCNVSVAPLSDNFVPSRRVTLAAELPTTRQMYVAPNLRTKTQPTGFGNKPIILKRPNSNSPPLSPSKDKEEIITRIISRSLAEDDTRSKPTNIKSVYNTTALKVGAVVGTPVPAEVLYRNEKLHGHYTYSGPNQYDDNTINPAMQVALDHDNQPKIKIPSNYKASDSKKEGVAGIVSIAGRTAKDVAVSAISKVHHLPAMAMEHWAIIAGTGAIFYLVCKRLKQKDTFYESFCKKPYDQLDRFAAVVAPLCFYLYGKNHMIKYLHSLNGMFRLMLQFVNGANLLKGDVKKYSNKIFTKFTNRVSAVEERGIKQMWFYEWSPEIEVASAIHGQWLPIEKWEDIYNHFYEFSSQFDSPSLKKYLANFKQYLGLAKFRSLVTGQFLPTLPWGSVKEIVDVSEINSMTSRIVENANTELIEPIIGDNPDEDDSESVETLRSSVIYARSMNDWMIGLTTLCMLSVVASYAFFAHRAAKRLNKAADSVIENAKSHTEIMDNIKDKVEILENIVLTSEVCEKDNCNLYDYPKRIESRTLAHKYTNNWYFGPELCYPEFASYFNQYLYNMMEITEYDLRRARRNLRRCPKIDWDVANGLEYVKVAVRYETLLNAYEQERYFPTSTPIRQSFWDNVKKVLNSVYDRVGNLSLTNYNTVKYESLPYFKGDIFHFEAKGKNKRGRGARNRRQQNFINYDRGSDEAVMYELAERIAEERARRLDWKDAEAEEAGELKITKELYREAKEMGFMAWAQQNGRASDFKIIKELQERENDEMQEKMDNEDAYALYRDGEEMKQARSSRNDLDSHDYEGRSREGNLRRDVKVSRPRSPPKRTPALKREPCPICKWFLSDRKEDRDNHQCTNCYLCDKKLTKRNGNTIEVLTSHQCGPLVKRKYGKVVHEKDEKKEYTKESLVHHNPSFAVPDPSTLLVISDSDGNNLGHLTRIGQYAVLPTHILRENQVGDFLKGDLWIHNSTSSTKVLASDFATMPREWKGMTVGLRDSVSFIHDRKLPLGSTFKCAKSVVKGPVALFSYDLQLNIDKRPRNMSCEVSKGNILDATTHDYDVSSKKGTCGAPSFDQTGKLIGFHVSSLNNGKQNQFEDCTLLSPIASFLNTKEAKNLFGNQRPPSPPSV